MRYNILNCYHYNTNYNTTNNEVNYFKQIYFSVEIIKYKQLKTNTIS